jgi:Short C-terminal domain
LTIKEGFSWREKKIPISQITSVQLKRATRIAGFIHLGVVGGDDGGQSPYRGRPRGVAGSENSVNFTRDQGADFEMLRAALEKMLSDRHRVTTPVAPPSAEGGSIPEQLAGLAQLRDAGVLTPEEFEAKKIELLARM